MPLPERPIPDGDPFRYAPHPPFCRRQFPPVPHEGWQRIRIEGEMLMGRAHHVIYFATPQAWLNYPEWARHRRDEIISRIKSVFCPPDYEHSWS